MSFLRNLRYLEYIVCTKLVGRDAKSTLKVSISSADLCWINILEIRIPTLCVGLTIYTCTQFVAVGYCKIANHFILIYSTQKLDRIKQRRILFYLLSDAKCQISFAGILSLVTSAYNLKVMFCPSSIPSQVVVVPNNYQMGFHLVIFLTGSLRVESMLYHFALLFFI